MLTKHKCFESVKTQLPTQKTFFQQDGAPAHRAKKTIQWLKRRTGLVEDWPPNSPDLSVIENVWGILKAKLLQRKPASLQELRRMLVEEWNGLPQATIDALIRSTPERMQLCIDHGGQSIGHLLRKHTEPKESTIPAVPKGFVTPRMISAKHVGSNVMMLGRITRVSALLVCPVRTTAADNTEATHGVQFHAEVREPTQYVPRGHIPRAIEVRVLSDNQEGWAIGTNVVIHGYVVAGNRRTLSDWGLERGAPRKDQSFQVFIEFAKFGDELMEPEDLLEVDSDIDPNLDHPGN
jgi:DNA replicative helicase MCM subunit Mcm2 (Cdc46/Mcm family)